MKKTADEFFSISTKEVFKRRQEFYSREIKNLEEQEKLFNEEVKKIRSTHKIKKKEISFILEMTTWIQLIHEMELLYTVLYQLTEHLEKDGGKINTLEKKSKFFNDEGIKWVLEELKQGLTEKENIGFGEKNE
jgi:hypothetical protein